MSLRARCVYFLLFSFCLILLCVISSATRADQERLPNLLENEHLLSLEVETPHTKWAKPYAGGKTRVVCIGVWTQGGSEGRGLIELMQRFDLDADVAYFNKGASRLLGDGNPRPYVEIDAGTQRVLRLLQTPPDVVFLNEVSFELLPEPVRQRIGEIVSAGSGIVLLGDATELPIANAQQVDTDEALDDAARCYSVGQGRGVLLATRTPLEYAVGWDVTLDYQMAAQGRALLWAADHSPKLALSATVSAAVFAREELAKQVVTVACPGDGSVDVDVQLRRWDGHMVAPGLIGHQDKGTVKFSLPNLRAGEYHVVAIARSSRGVENWVATPFEVTSDSNVRQVDLERDWAEPGETIAATVSLDGAAARDHTLVVRLLDDGGRILVRQQVEIKDDDTAACEFPIQSWMPMLLRVEAALSDTAGEISSAYAYLRVTKRHQDQFNFVVWNWPSGDLAPYGMKSLARYGATAVLQGGTPPLSLAAANLSFVPYASSYRKSSHTVTAMLDENGIMKGGCTNDPEVMDEWVSTTVARHHEARGHGVLVYSLGDENAVRGSCLSGHCLHAYQDYLQEIYGNVDALNAEWETQYASFDTITLLEGKDLPAADAPRWFKEFFAQRLQKNRTDNEGDGEQQIIFGDKNDEMLALQAENYARWYDRQAFQCKNYVEWCKHFARAFRELDPQSLTGFEGTDSFTLRRLTTRSRQGGDLDAFVRELEYFGPYHGPGNEVVRSIVPPTFPMGNWMGYSMDREVLLERYWGQVTNCMNTPQWWRWDNLDGYHGFLSPTFAPFPGGKELFTDTQVVRDGLGSLLMQCRMQDDEVAMLYSMPSTHIAHFDGNRSYGKCNRDHEIWYNALHDSGVQFRYVTDRMMRLGEFDAASYKILILPLSFAIGPQEAAVIRQFVRDGGTLLADVRTGTYDGHCKPQDAGILDDVFGIERNGKQDAVKVDRLALAGEIGERTVSLRWGNWFGKEIYPRMKVDPTVSVTTGKPLGEAFPIHYWGGLKHPVCIVNEFGKGRAILLNFPVYNAPFQPLLEGILAAAGVTAKIEVRTPTGDRVPGLEVTRWSNGGIELVALLGDHEGDVTLTLAEDRHVYDLKAPYTAGGKDAFGMTDQFTTHVRPRRASFFALFGEQARAPRVRLDRHQAARGETIKLSLSIPSADGQHALRVSATTPDGKVAEWFKQQLIVAEQLQTVELPIAHNDPTGVWQVRVTDLYTGKPISKTFTVSE